MQWHSWRGVPGLSFANRSSPFGFSLESFWMVSAKHRRRPCLTAQSGSKDEGLLAKQHWDLPSPPPQASLLPLCTVGSFRSLGLSAIFWHNFILIHFSRIRKMSSVRPMPRCLCRKTQQSKQCPSETERAGRPFEEKRQAEILGRYAS